MAGNHAVFVAESASWVAANLSSRLERLREEGFVVHVAAVNDGGFPDLPSECLARPLPGGVAGWPGAFVLLQSHFIEHRPLLVHGFGEPWAWFAALAARQIDAPAVFANVDHHLLGTTSRPKMLELAKNLGLPVDAAWERLYRFLANSVDRYVTTTHADMEIAQEFVPGQKLEVALGGYGVDVQAMNPYDSSLPDKDELRRRLGLNQRGVIGVADLSSDPTSSSLKQSLRRAIPGVDLVSITDGQFDDLRQYFRALDLFVVPQNGPRSCQLAAAAACPVVALDTRENREAVAHEETGELCDAESLVNVAASLFNDPARAERYGVRARTRAVSRFDRRQVDDQMLRLYDAVLRGKMG